MLFLVISKPHPSRPDESKAGRMEFRDWIKNCEAQNKLLHSYPLVGRGFMAVFNVDSNEELHQLLTQWTNLVPVSFEIHPLVSPAAATELLK